MLEFELPYEYRSGSDEDIQNCSIGPNIIRKLLTETLNEEWSIAVYVPYHKEQMNTTDAQRSKDFEAWNGSDLNPELIRERQEWIYRAKELKHCDMRQFFRAGFHQVVDQTAFRTCDFISRMLQPMTLPRRQLYARERRRWIFQLPSWFRHPMILQHFNEVKKNRNCLIL